MKQKKIKAFFAVAAIAAVGLGSYKAYGSYTAANMSEEDLFLAENVSALSQSDVNSHRYPKRDGNPDFCTLYVYMSGSVVVSKGTDENPQYEGKAEYTKSKVRGLEDRCPDKGSGCDPYSCQEIPY